MAVNPWLAVEHRHLPAWDAVARTGLFHGGANELRYVQSPIGPRNTRLETPRGGRVIDRPRSCSALSTSPTHEGLNPM